MSPVPNSRRGPGCGGCALFAFGFCLAGCALWWSLGAVYVHAEYGWSLTTGSYRHRAHELAPANTRADVIAACGAPERDYPFTDTDGAPSECLTYDCADSRVYLKRGYYVGVEEGDGRRFMDSLAGGLHSIR